MKVTRINANLLLKYIRFNPLSTRMRDLVSEEVFLLITEELQPDETIQKYLSELELQASFETPAFKKKGILHIVDVAKMEKILHQFVLIIG